MRQLSLRFSSLTLIAVLLAGGLVSAPQKAEAARSVSFLQFASDSTALSVHTFSSQNLGTAAADRYIFVIVHGEEKGGPITSVTVTIGGISATTDVFVDDPGNGDIAAIARALVPNGTTGNIVVTTNDLTGIGVGVYRASGIGIPVLKKTTTDIGAPINLSINNTAGSLMFAGVSIDDDTSAITSIGLTENYDAAIGPSTDRSAGGFIFPAAGTATMSFDNAGGTNAAGVAATYAVGTGLAKPANNLGLVGYWPFNEGTSTTAGDFSGNGNTGSLDANPASWVNGRFDKALQFTHNSTDGVNIGDINATDGVSKLTVSAWVYDTTGTAAYSIVSKFWGIDQNWALFTSDAGGDRMEFLPDGSSGGYTPAGSHQKGVWEHWVAVFDGTQGTDAGKLKIYKNGVSQTLTIVNTPIPSATLSTARVARIGSDGDDNAQFTGKIDEVRIYNRALSATEVATLYAGGTAGAARANASSKTLTNGSSLSRGLVGLWTFDGGDTRWTSETTGVTYDGSGNRNDGTMTNMTRSVSSVIGKLGQGFSFNYASPSSYVNAGSAAALDNLSKLSVCLWLYYSGNNASYRQVIAKTPDGTSGWQLYILNGGSRGLGFQSQTQDGTEVGLSATQMPDNAWTHICATADGLGNSDSVKIYVNGVDQNGPHLGTVGSFDDSGNNLEIGGASTGAGVGLVPLGGRLDDVRLYNRILSASEVKQLYLLGKVNLKP